MGGALIELMRGRYGPSRVSSAWALASSPTGAERFAREVSFRWERAAADLEDLIRARMPPPGHEQTAETAATAPPGAAPARLHSGVVPRDREADPPPAGPARRIPSFPVRPDAGGRRMPLEPSWTLAAGFEAWSDATGEGADPRPRRARGEGAPGGELEPEPLPCEESDHPISPEAPRRLESKAWTPSRGSFAVGPGETPRRRVDPGRREGSALDPGAGIAVPHAPLEEPPFPGRGGAASSPDAGASFLGAGRRRFHGLEESPRRLPRDGGSTAPADASGRSPRRFAPPGPPLELLVEEARRRAEALEDWERTGF